MIRLTFNKRRNMLLACVPDRTSRDHDQYTTSLMSQASLYEKGMLWLSTVLVVMVILVHNAGPRREGGRRSSHR